MRFWEEVQKLEEERDYFEALSTRQAETISRLIFEKEALQEIVNEMALKLKRLEE